MEFEPNNPDVATKTEAESESKDTCAACQKPLATSNSGSVTQWLFKGLYCACEETPAAPKETITTFFAPEGMDSWSQPPESVSHEPLRFGFPPQKTAPEQAHKALYKNVRLVPPGAVFKTSAPIPESIDHNGEVISPFDLNGAAHVPMPEPNTLSSDVLPAGRLAQNDPEKLIGKTIGQYKIDAFMAKGASGHVFKAHHQGSLQVVALKLVTPSLNFGKRHNQRFLNEARAAKNIEHDNVITLYDVGLTGDEIPYLVTEFFEGRRLNDVLKHDGPISETDAINLFIQICQGLSHAHYMGVMHRDVKPSNIRIDENKHVKVVDCGVSKVLPDPTRETRYFTESGFEYGDARYMSPEQCRGAKTDHRSDIYSLGCLMYECLSGKTPFSAEKNSMLIYKHVKKRPRSLNSRFPDLQLSRDLENLIMRCLEKEPDDRYQSISDMLDDLMTIRSEKQVKRAFRKNLQITPEKREQLSIAEVLSAALSSVWFGASSTTRLLTLCIVLLTLASSSILLILDNSKRNRPQPTTNPWTYYREIQNDYSDRLERLRKESEEMLAALTASKSQFQPEAEIIVNDVIGAQTRAMKDNPGGQVFDAREIDLLERRLLKLKSSAGADSLSATNVIRNSQQGTLYIAPQDASKEQALLAAIRDDADLTDADLSNIKLAGITISSANLTNANFSGSDLTGASFKDVSMTDARFDNANLDMAQFENVNATGSSFQGTSLRGATFANSSIENAKLRDANFEDSDIFGGKTANLTVIKTNLDNAIIFQSGNTVDVSGTPDLVALTKTKSEFEKRLIKLSEVSNVAAVLKQASTTEKIRLPMAGSDQSVMMSAFTNDATSALDAKLDAALGTCRSAISDARNLRRLEIVSAKTIRPEELKTSLKKLADSMKKLDGQIADVDREIAIVQARQAAANPAPKGRKYLFSPSVEVREQM